MGSFLNNSQTTKVINTVETQQPQIPVNYSGDPSKQIRESQKKHNRSYQLIMEQEDVSEQSEREPTLYSTGNVRESTHKGRKTQDMRSGLKNVLLVKPDSENLDERAASTTNVMHNPISA